MIGHTTQQHQLKIESHGSMVPGEVGTLTGAGRVRHSGTVMLGEAGVAADSARTAARSF